MTHKISPSQMYAWKQCPRSWYFSYVLKIKKKQQKARFFELGTYFHELMHVYYQAVQEGHKPGSDFLVSYIESRIRRDMGTITEDNVGIIAQVSKMVMQYVASYSPTIDRDIAVVGVELVSQVPQKTPGGNDVILNCITDLLYRRKTGKLVVRDHKTGQGGSWKQEMLPLENQLLFNAAAIWQATGEMPTEVEISFANSYNYKTKSPTVSERFQKFSHVHNEHAIEFYLKDVLRLMDRMIEEENPVHFYSKDCAKCPYNAICSQELRGFNTDNLIASQYEKVERDYEVGLKSSTAAVEASKDSTGNKEPFKVSLKLH